MLITEVKRKCKINQTACLPKEEHNLLNKFETLKIMKYTIAYI